MLSHGYIKNDFDVDKWAAPEFLEKAATEVLEEEWKKATAGKASRGRPIATDASRCGSDNAQKENRLWLSLE